MLVYQQQASSSSGCVQGVGFIPSSSTAAAATATSISRFSTKVDRRGEGESCCDVSPSTPHLQLLDNTTTNSTTTTTTIANNNNNGSSPGNSLLSCGVFVVQGPTTSNNNNNCISATVVQGSTSRDQTLRAAAVLRTCAGSITQGALVSNSTAAGVISSLQNTRPVRNAHFTVGTSKTSRITEFSLDTLYEEVYHEQQPEQDSLNLASGSTTNNNPRESVVETCPEPAAAPRPRRAASSLLRLLQRKRLNASLDMAERGEPFRQMWVVLSTLYGQALVLVMLACCVTEVMDNAVHLFSLQGYLLIYLYVGSIAVIMCIYIWVLVDSCGALSSSRPSYDSEDETTDDHGANRPWQDSEAAGPTLTRFGSLKRAHRPATSGTSFYVRVGAIVFGLAALVFTGLEVAMHTSTEVACLSDIYLIHPILHALFTFLQMHFLFVNSQVVVERFGMAARFGFMHLAGTNVALWVRLVVWESGTEWAHQAHLANQHGAASFVPSPLELRGFPRDSLHHGPWVHNGSLARGPAYELTPAAVSSDHLTQVLALHECLNANSLGQLWTSAQPFLFPFIVQFSLISAAVTFVMGLKVGQTRHVFSSGKPSKSCSGVDCGSSSRGLFSGLLCVAVGLVVTIVFFVVRADQHDAFPRHLAFWLSLGTQGTLLVLAAALSLVGLAQVRRLSGSSGSPARLDQLLAGSSSCGVLLYATFSLAAGVGLILENIRQGVTQDGRAVALVACSALQLLHVSLQSSLCGEVSRRQCTTRGQLVTRPGRQIVTFLLCVNAIMWVFDTLVTFSWASQELQLQFFGVLTWGVVSRVSLPLLVLHRFHACVTLLAAWQRAYN